MRHTALLLCLVGSAVVAQVPQPGRERAAANGKSTSFPALEQRIGGYWTARWNAATNTPRAIIGSGWKIPDWRGDNVDEARRCALRALQQQGDLLGLGDSEFRELIGARMGHCWSFTFAQFHRGLPCVGGRADVRVNSCGVIAMLGSTAWSIPAGFDVTPKLDEVEAEARAWLHLEQRRSAARQPARAQGNRLVLWADLDADRAQVVQLAWEVPISNVDAEGRGAIGRYYIDARTGAVLNYHSDKHECAFEHGAEAAHDADCRRDALQPTTVTVMGWTGTGISAADPIVNIPMVGLVVSVPGFGNLTTDANGQFTIDITAPVTITLGAIDGVHNAPISDTTGNAPTASVTVQPGVPAVLQVLSNLATLEQVAHTNSHYWVRRSNEWARSIFGNTSQLNVLDNVTPSVNRAGNCNAFYSGNTINFYPAGNTCTNTAMSTVIAHEWGHGLDDRYGGVFNANGDGLSEGWGDTIAMYLVDDPIIGREFTPGGFVRTGLNSTLYGSQFEVHAAGESFMGFAWRCRENLRSTLGTAQAVAISNNVVLGSIVANARNQVDAVTEVFLADDVDGNLANGVPHYAQLSTAAAAKGLPFPPIQIVVANHVPLADTTFRLTPRLVEAVVTAPGSGSIAQVRLVYSSGGAPTTKVMRPSPTASGYQSLLPGLDNGVMSYHLDCQHSTGAVVRIPASGEFVYTVSAPLGGTLAPIYSTDFESGNAGWSHGSGDGITPDDWQFDLPAGRQGNSLGVGWRDPNNAASGSFCYGTDLGRNGGDGAYSANLESWLRSPVLDCSGHTGVILRFKRWLTVEQGIFDHAQIYVNGLLLWANPGTGHVLDTAWQQIELPMPMADNNPSVQIEWRLVSDGGLQLGGWNLDDVEVGSRAVLPQHASMTLLPAEVGPNTLLTYTVQTEGPQPFLALIGDQPGPSFVPGLPLLQLGGNGQALVFFTDNNGQFSQSFPSLASIPATGLRWYLQVLTFDAQGNIVASNPWINLLVP